MKRQVDYLIIGQGLAGSLLSWELMKRGASILVIDNQQENASQIAAGLINPITGMRLVINKGIDSLLPCAKQTYQELSRYFKQEFYIEKPMLRLLRTEKETNKFQQRTQQPAYLNYLETELKYPSDSIHAPLGSVQQKQTGYLLTQQLLSQLKKFFLQNQSYRATQLDYRELNLNHMISWQDICAKKIIFCEGYNAIHNPWFNYLPFQLAKGEILTLTTEKTLPSKILNFGHWFIPLNNNQFRTGATFDPINLNTQPTQAGKNTLLHSLSSVIPSLANASISSHQANIRPTTLDKAPFIGQHPTHQQLYIFNGFGAKGSLQIPYYSQQLVQHLLQQSPIATDINCQRFTSL